MIYLFYNFLLLIGRKNTANIIDTNVKNIIESNDTNDKNTQNPENTQKSENTQNHENTQNTEKIIVNYKNSSYDITTFIKKHPGGKKYLIENNGKDIEQLMIDNDHSHHAYKLLDKYKIN